MLPELPDEAGGGGPALGAAPLLPLLDELALLPALPELPELPEDPELDEGAAGGWLGACRPRDPAEASGGSAGALRLPVLGGVTGVR